MALFIVIQEPGSEYRDEEGVGYEYWTSLPNGRQIMEGDSLLCSLKSRPSGERIFGIGSIGAISRYTRGGREYAFAKYEEYRVFNPYLTFGEIGGDPRINMQHSMNRVPDDRAERILEIVGSDSRPHVKVVEGSKKSHKILPQDFPEELKEMLGIVEDTDDGSDPPARRYAESLNWTKATEALTRCLRLKGISEGDVFTLRDAMEAQPVMELIYPDNKNLDGKIRQQLQVMREHGHVEFVNNKGVYRMLK